MPVIEEDVHYEVLADGRPLDSFEFASDASDYLADRGVDGAPDEDTLVAWEVDHEEAFVDGDGQTFVLRKSFDEEPYDEDDD